MVEQGNKQVRVDNWGTFFLQRLQVFFAKTDYCDLTLQFDGNVQLKVHRLVMNACTEYFKFLEETCPAVEENTIIMPHDLQSDVIVPIVNFMYTGMLEFHVSLYEKLFKAAELMNIHILTKLLEAQKIPLKSPRPKPDPSPIKKPLPPPPKSPKLFEIPTSSPSSSRKVWKRKIGQPSGSPHSLTHPTSQLQFDQKWSNTVSDPLADNTPKPTRFEWPDDDLPTMSLLDTSFEDISYTSKPLLTKEEEEKINPSFDDLRNNLEFPKKIVTKSTNNAVNLKEMEEFAKEQKIRNAMFEEVGEFNDIGQKRKSDPNSPMKFASKKIKTNNKENKETTISVESVSSTDIDHTKIVTEILKKYPDLVKKNKNIKLKIMPGNKESSDKKIVIEPAKSSPKQQEVKVQKQVRKTKLKQTEDEGPWVCKKCINVDGRVQEFVLYYLYRKHMTDVHNEVFDPHLCKYCGRRCNTHTLMAYHLYTNHSLKPPSSYNFPKCNRCAYIAISTAKLLKHKELHDSNEMQCQDCQLAFITAQFLATHVRRTGHYNKPGKFCYDCQYCMKKLQSGMALFTHVRKRHLSEANRDGIVCLEEIESLEDLEDDENEGTEEYIIPEILNENVMQKDKVKIISNVKVPHDQQNTHSNQQSQLVPMETNAEAEALNSVASGIATSLGLVDIVVLDENQQYILQQDSQNEQTEFIIPELGHGQPFTGQVITTQDNTVIQQGMIQSSTGEITSTDELVMVLTDHDYPEGHEGENPDNSNIVVLYSHPVDGQEGQFITSQGNLLVNSQTGMLELRNGSAITTTTANQMIVTNSIDTPIESIEMIQREIDNHTELKQEPYFEEERKPSIHHETLKPSSNNVQCINVSVSETEPLPLADKPTMNEESTIVETVFAEASSQESIEETPGQLSEIDEGKDTSEDNVDSALEVSTEECMEIGNVEHKTAETEYQEVEQPEEISLHENAVVPETLQPTESDQGNGEQYVQEISNNDEVVDAPIENSHIDNDSEEVFNDHSTIGTDEPPKSDEEKEHLEHEIEPQDQSEPTEADEKLEEMENEEQAEDVNSAHSENLLSTNVEVSESVEKDPGDSVETADYQEHVQMQEENIIDIQENTSVVPAEDAQMLENETQVTEEETQVSQDVEQIALESETVVQQSQADDEEKNKICEENKPPSPKPVQRKIPTDINKTILDDWEDDTDSQQSEKNAESSESQDVQVSNQETIPSAVENVNKLMDDWEEEDEEDKKN